MEQNQNIIGGIPVKAINKTKVKPTKTMHRGITPPKEKKEKKEKKTMLFPYTLKKPTKIVLNNKDKLFLKKTLRTTNLKKKIKPLKPFKTTLKKTKKTKKTKAKAKTSSISALENTLAGVNLGKDITIKAQIWGHAGQTRVRDQTDAYFKPIPSMQLNIFGFAISGMCNISNEENVLIIDETMRKTHIWPPNPEEFKAEYAKIYDTIKPEDMATLRPVRPESAEYAYIENYGNENSGKKRGNKLYYGLNDASEPFAAVSHLVGVTTAGPNLRIYEIIVDGRNIITIPIDIQLANGTSLNGIMHAINQFFHKNTGLFAAKFRSIGLEPGEFTKIILNLLDLTCNSAEDPDIGAVTVGKKDK
jgi:hypothetical protein